MDQSLKRAVLFMMLVAVSCTACAKQTEYNAEQKEARDVPSIVLEAGKKVPHPYKLIKNWIAVPLSKQITGIWPGATARASSSNDISDEKTQEKPEKQDIKGIYLNREAIKENRIQKYIDMVQDTDLNAVVIDVKDDAGKLTYPSDVDVAEDIQSDEEATVSDMKTLVQRLKKEGIYTIARIVAFKDPFLAEHQSEWAIHEKDGGIWEDESDVKWIDPYKKDVWDYVTNIAEEVADFGFDEIQYDYIRFPENAQEIDKFVDYDNPDDTSKTENINQFLQQSSAALQDYPVRTSADVFGLVTSASDDMGIGQLWEKVSPHVDYISPMIYPSHYDEGIYDMNKPNNHPHELVTHALEDAVSRNQKLGDERALIRPWVQDFNLERTYTAEDIQDQIRAIKEQGIEQFLVWNAASDYTKEAY